MKNGVPATAPSIRAACAEWVRRSSAILTRGVSGFASTFASAHSRECSARCSAAYNAIRSVTCSGSRYPRRTKSRVPLQARESLPAERSSTRSGLAMARLASARRGSESAGSRALDGRGRGRRRDGSEECDSASMTIPAITRRMLRNPRREGKDDFQPGPSRRTGPPLELRRPSLLCQAAPAAIARSTRATTRPLGSPNSATTATTAIALPPRKPPIRPDGAARPWDSGRRPRELDLELRLVVGDLELDLQIDLVGHLGDEAQVLLLHHDVVAGGQLVRDRAKPGRRGLPGQRLALLEFHQLHCLLPCCRRAVVGWGLEMPVSLRVRRSPRRRRAAAPRPRRRRSRFRRSRVRGTISWRPWRSRRRRA